MRFLKSLTGIWLIVGSSILLLSLSAFQQKVTNDGRVVTPVHALKDVPWEKSEDFPTAQSITATVYLPIVMKSNGKTVISINYVAISSVGGSWQEAFDGTLQITANFYDFGAGILTHWDDLYQEYFYSIDRGYIEFRLPDDYTQGQSVSIKLPYGCFASSPDNDSSNIIYELRGGRWNGQLGSGTPKETWDTLYDNKVIGTINSNDCTTNPNFPIPTLDDSQLVPLDLGSYQGGDTVKLVLIYPDEGTVAQSLPPVSDANDWFLFANTGEAEDLTVVIVSP